MSRAHPECAQAVEALWFMSIILKARYAIRLAISAATSTAKVCLTPRKILPINRPLRVATDYRNCLSQRQHERAKRPSASAHAMMSIAFPVGHWRADPGERLLAHGPIYLLTLQAVGGGCCGKSSCPTHIFAIFAIFSTNYELYGRPLRRIAITRRQ